MSNPSGAKADPKYPTRRPGPATTDGAQVKRQVQPKLNADDRKFSKPPPAQPATEDWRRG
jgi:hypothetical protein